MKMNNLFKRLDVWERLLLVGVGVGVLAMVLTFLFAVVSAPFTVGANIGAGIMFLLAAGVTFVFIVAFFIMLIARTIVERSSKK